MANIKDYPLRKLADFLNFAYEKELYERWLTLYPIMEARFIKFISFKDYKEKALEKVKTNVMSNRLTDEEILKHGLEIVKVYERNQQKAGEKNGNI